MEGVADGARGGGAGNIVQEGGGEGTAVLAVREERVHVMKLLLADAADVNVDADHYNRHHTHSLWSILGVARYLKSRCDSRYVSRYLSHDTIRITILHA